MGSMATTRDHRQYDHRLKSLVRETGDIRIAIANGVPRSTVRDWSRSPTGDVVSLDVLSLSEQALQQEVLALRQQSARRLSILRLLVMLVKVTRTSLVRRRVPDGAKKERLLHAVDRSRDVLSLRTALRLLGLSSNRYHTWKREE
jgi:hypothetical protein